MPAWGRAMWSKQNCSSHASSAFLLLPWSRGFFSFTSGFGIFTKASMEVYGLLLVIFL